MAQPDSEDVLNPQAEGEETAEAFQQAWEEAEMVDREVDDEDDPTSVTIDLEVQNAVHESSSEFGGGGGGEATTAPAPPESVDDPRDLDGYDGPTYDLVDQDGNVIETFRADRPFGFEIPEGQSLVRND